MVKLFPVDGEKRLHNSSRTNTFRYMKESFAWIHSRVLFDEQSGGPPERWFLFLLLGCATILRLIGITYGLPAVYNGTEYYIAKQALAMGARHSLEPLFFVYPTFFTYIVALLAGVLFLGGVLIGLFHTPDDFAFQFLVNPSFFYLSGRLLTAASFIFALYLFYRTLRFFLPVRTAFLFAFLFLFSWNIQFYTFWMVPDSGLLLGTIIVIYLLVKFFHHSHLKKSLYLAAFISGLTVSTKYNAGFLPLAPLTTAFLYFPSNRQLQRIIGVGLFILAGFVVGSPYWILRFSDYINGFYTLLTQSSVDFNTTRGIPFLWELGHLLTTDWGTGLVVILGIGVAISSFRPNHSQWIPLALVVLPTFGVVGLMQKKGLDYLLIIFPLTFVLIAMFLGKHHWSRHHARWLNRALSILLIPGIFIVGHLKFQQTQPDTREMASHWIRTHIPPRTLLCYDNYHFDLSLLDIQRFTTRGFGSQFLSARLKERIQQLQNRPDVYRFSPIRHTLPQPRWPTSFTSEELRRYRQNPFLVEAYQHPFKTLHDLQLEGVQWLIVNGEWASKFYHAPLPPKNNPLYPLYLSKRIFYQTLFENFDADTVFYGNWRHPGPPLYIFKINPE